MSKSKQLFDLIMYVNAKRNFTAQEVADELQISVRTAHRYLLEISEMGVPLYTEPGRNGGYRILNNRVLPPILFNENEAFAIFFAFQSLKYYKSLPFEVDIKSVSQKLYIGLPSDTRKKIDNLNNILSFWNKKRIMQSPFIKEIIEASTDHQILTMTYQSQSNNTEREVVPIGVYAYDGLWYTPAYDISLKEIRLFRLDRMISIIKTHKNFNPGIQLNQWLENQLSEDAMASTRLSVELSREGIRQCMSQPWLEPHIKILDPDHGIIDTMIQKTELEFVSNYFLQLGIYAKVTEPQEVIHMIRRKLQDTLQHYLT